MSGLGADIDSTIATLGGIECWLLAIIYRSGHIDYLVFPLAVDGSLVAEKAHGQCAVGAAGNYVCAAVVFYRAIVMARANGEFGGRALGVSGDRAQCLARLSAAADLSQCIRSDLEAV